MTRMSDDQMHKKVLPLANVRVELPSYGRNLRAQLIARHARQHASQNWLVSAFKTMYNFRENIYTMNITTKIASVTGITAIVVIAGFALANFLAPTPVNAAQEQLKSMQTITAEMDPQEKAQLEQRIGSDIDRRLKEGAQAKDARFLSNEEFQHMTGVDPENYKAQIKTKDPSMADIKSYVAFTGSDGLQTIIAVGENNQPLLVLASY